MKKKVIPAFMAVLILFLAVGCQKVEENREGETTKPPVEAVTNALSQETKGTPSPEGTQTGSVQGEDSMDLMYTFREEIEEEKDGDFVYFRSILRYPVFEGEKAEEINGFVASLSEGFREFLPEAREDAKYNYEDSLLAEFAFSGFPESEEFIVKCLWETSQYVTLFTQNISDTGGAHPNVFCQAYVVDLTDGCQVSLERMLEPYGLTMENMIEYATERIRKVHGEALYEYDDADDLEKDVVRFMQENQWYFNENGLVLFANPYEIAAYAYGIIECEISYEELEQGLKK